MKGESRIDEHDNRGWATEPHELLARVIQAGRVGIWESDLNNGKVEWNSNLRGIAGVPPDQPASFDAWLELVHPQDMDMARRIIASERQSSEGRFRIIRPDGEVRHVLVRVDRVEVEGNQDRRVGVVIDVSEGQRVAAQITSTLEAISDGYFAINRDWTVSYINPKGVEFLGISKEDLVGRNLWEAFPEAVGSTFERYRETMDDGVELQFEEFYEPLDKWFEVRSYPTSHGIAVYFRDVTARHRAEQERTRMLEAERAARERAERTEARMVHQATHDSLTDLLNRTDSCGV